MCGDRSGCFHHKGRANSIMFIASIYGGEIVEALAISELTLTPQFAKSRNQYFKGFYGLNFRTNKWEGRLKFD